jgi:hypothetical protein
MVPAIVILAICIGGVVEAFKRMTAIEARWYKDGVLPLLPVVLGLLSALFRDVSIQDGLLAALASGWVYDRWKDQTRLPPS